MHDTPIAHAGALGGRSGVVVIAGTGSVVYGRNDEGGRARSAAGDSCSATREVRFRSLATRSPLLMRAQDEDDSSFAAATRASVRVLRACRRCARSCTHSITESLTRDRLAVVRPDARCVRSAATHRAARRRPAGGVGTRRSRSRRAGDASRSSAVSSPTPAFASAFATGFWRRFHVAEIVTARYEPAYGALLLAYRERALSVTELRQ